MMADLVVTVPGWLVLALVVIGFGIATFAVLVGLATWAYMAGQDANGRDRALIHPQAPPVRCPPPPHIPQPIPESRGKPKSYKE